ncbi:hypothetical protein [Chromobacterium haemolyticum]|uniref:hypothetical protein n=1 Tax=Chromobacterium TaxID=535 RepID=UPI0040577D5F
MTNHPRRFPSSDFGSEPDYLKEARKVPAASPNHGRIWPAIVTLKTDPLTKLKRAKGVNNHDR